MRTRMREVDDLNRQNEVKNSKLCWDNSNLTAMRLLISSFSQPSFPLINFPRYSALLELQPYTSLKKKKKERKKSRIQRLKSPFTEPWGFMVILSVIGGISNLMETNAVDQWRLRLLFTTTGHLGTLICIVIGHLRGTVKTFHKVRLEWHYVWDSVVVTPWVEFGVPDKDGRSI